MKRLICCFTALLIAVLLVLPLPAAAKGSKAAESRNGVVRVMSLYYSEDVYATGSGLAVGEEGESSSIFVTNNHVIAGADEVYILLDNDWQYSVPAFGGIEDNVHAVKCEVVSTPAGGSPDYAILRASRIITERVALPLMPAQQAFPGDPIFTLGYPGVSDAVTDTITADIDSITITSGTISRFATFESESSRAIQIDADINHGNSGGPLITEEGYVIGLNTWGVGNEDGTVNLALEIDYVINCLNDLIESNKLPDFTFTVINDRSEGAEGNDSDEKKDEDDAEEDNTLLIWIGIAVVAAAGIMILVMRSNRTTPPAPAPRASASIPSKPEVKSETPAEPPKKAAEPFKDLDEFSIRFPLKESAPVTPVKPVKPVTPAGAAFCLVGQKGQFAGKTISVGKDLRMGRNSTNDLVYAQDTPGISGSHCLLSPRSNGIAIMDLGSTYGTLLLNGTKLTPNQKYLLKHGDIFCLGSSNQTFLVQQADAQPVAAGKTFCIIGETGQFAGKKFQVSRDLHIGRSHTNEISYPVDYPGISASHCVLSPRSNGIAVMDLGSTYGTRLPNGTKLEPNQKYLLKPGDRFVLGSSKEQFRVE